MHTKTHIVYRYLLIKVVTLPYKNLTPYIAPRTTSFHICLSFKSAIQAYKNSAKIVKYILYVGIIFVSEYDISFNDFREN